MNNNEKRWVGFGEMLQTAQHADIHVQHEGEVTAVIVNIKRYHLLLQAFEEMQDIRAFDEAMEEDGENIPWETVKEELGWS